MNAYTCLATTAPTITSTYSGSLSSSSLSFIRTSTNEGDYYYYQAIQMISSMNGTYIFFSNSSIDTYGYFYYDSFDPLHPLENLITSDDDSNSARQFRISATLQFQRKYILVVTTYGIRITGDFLIKAVGPTSIDLTPMNQMISE